MVSLDELKFLSATQSSKREIARLGVANHIGPQHIVREYREFPGKFVNEMPKLIAAGYSPITVYDVFWQRIHSPDKFWIHTNIDTVTGVLGFKNNYVIFNKSTELSKVHKNRLLSNLSTGHAGGIVFSPDFMQRSRCDIISMDHRRLEGYSEDVDSYELQVRNLFLKRLLTDTYDDVIDFFNKVQKGNNNLGKVVLHESSRVPLMYAMRACSLEDNFQIKGHLPLNYEEGNLVGVKWKN